MLITGLAGAINTKQSVQTNPQGNAILLDNVGGILKSSFMHDHYAMTYNGMSFSVSNQTAVTTTAALATTFTGLVVGNPAGNTFNMVLHRFEVSQFAVGAASVVGIMAGQSTTAITNTITPVNRLYGTGRPTTMAASAGQTIGTPVLIATVGQLGSLATTGYNLQQGIVIDVDGGIIIPPGYFVASYTSIVTTTALQFTFAYMEVPL